MSQPVALQVIVLVFTCSFPPSPEELLAMILTKAQETASAFTEQPITGAVVTVPAFFSQAERRAVEIACDLAGIKLLQLMTDNAAVALNYGVFR